MHARRLCIVRADAHASMPITTVPAGRLVGGTGDAAGRARVVLGAEVCVGAEVCAAATRCGGVGDGARWLALAPRSSEGTQVRKLPPSEGPLPRSLASLCFEGAVVAAGRTEAAVAVGDAPGAALTPSSAGVVTSRW